MLFLIQHETKLSYSEPVSETVFEVRMSPPSDENQTNLGYRLKITPSAPVTINRDGFGNRVDLFNVMTPYRELVIWASSIVRTHRPSVEARLSEIPWNPDHSDFKDLEASEYSLPSKLVAGCPELDAFLAPLREPADTLGVMVRRVLDAVRSRLTYEKKVTTARTPLREVLTLNRGVCQDFVHLFLGACRGLGLPARYVSGYVSEVGELATHAWCQVYAGPLGWVDIDPTRGSFVDETFVTLAVGRDYSDVPPNRGVWKGHGDENIAVAVKVEPISRVPIDWTNYSTQQPWSSTSWVQSERASSRPRLMNSQSGYRQQQSQQQQ